MTLLEHEGRTMTHSVTHPAELHPLPAQPCPCPAGTRSPADVPCGGIQRANVVGGRGWDSAGQRRQSSRRISRGCRCRRANPRSARFSRRPRAEGSGTEPPPAGRPQLRRVLAPGQERWDVPGRAGGTEEQRARGEAKARQSRHVSGARSRPGARERAERPRGRAQRPRAGD